MTNYELIDSAGIWKIHKAAFELIDLLHEPLSGMLQTGEDIRDCIDARAQLIRSRTVTKTLLAHLENNYSFDSTVVDGHGWAEVKVGKCLE